MRSTVRQSAGPSKPREGAEGRQAPDQKRPSAAGAEPTARPASVFHWREPVPQSPFHSPRPHGFPATATTATTRVRTPDLDRTAGSQLAFAVSSGRASQTLRQPATSELALSLELESRQRFGLRTELDQAQGPLRLVHLEHAVRMPRHDATQPLPLALHVTLVLLLAPRTNKVLAASSRAAMRCQVTSSATIRGAKRDKPKMLPKVAVFGRKVR